MAIAIDPDAPKRRQADGAEVPAWQVGDVVRLRSGGPPMTVVVDPADGDAKVQCEWFSDGLLYDGAWLPACLRREP